MDEQRETGPDQYGSGNYGSGYGYYPQNPATSGPQPSDPQPSDPRPSDAPPPAAYQSAGHWYPPTNHQPQFGYPQQPGYPQPGYWAPPPAPAATFTPPAPTASPRRRRRRVLLASGIAAAIAAICVGTLVQSGLPISIVGSGSSNLVPDSTGNGSSSGSGGSSGSGSSSGSGQPGGSGSGTGNTGGTGTTGGATSTGTATAAQQVGVVDINTVLKYQQARAAGTGLVLTSKGEILTNNHVVSGATSISVTIVSTGRTYTATVVGTDPTADVAVLQLSNASGLTTAKISANASVAVGDAVTAVGNAGGVGGTPSTASGTVVALDQSITASDEGSGSGSENLTGLIQSNAPIQAGDSGGPLYNAKGQVVGIDTAGSSSSRFGSGAATQAYSIPIATAIAVAGEIEAGHASSTVHLGYPAFLGVEVASTDAQGGFGQTDPSTGALVSGVISGTPADGAGLSAGDTITAVGSTTITAASQLSTALSKYDAGQSVKITWTDAAGQSHSASVHLIQGPAD